MSSSLDKVYEKAAHLRTLLDDDPAEAIQQARRIDLASPDRLDLMSLKATILVDGGALTQQREAIEEGLSLLRYLHGRFSNRGITSIWRTGW